MWKIPDDYIEKVYAGWLAKIIGIRLGAAVEGWTYEQIERTYGELTHYPVDFNEFAADDDSNGPLFFLRALLQVKPGEKLKANDVAEALLNYAPYEHGFFWWGGYGISTEHTAYLNLRSGIPAPRSGSIEQNGYAVAEQIGGQIFIDTWGLVTPGNPDLAAEMAEKASSVTHDGNGIYGGIFVATCISYAFVETDIRKIIRKGLSYIPRDCDYARVVNAVIRYYDTHPNSWRDCYKYIFENFGYDKYPGNCHIIPNIAVMILALLYGHGDFSNTLNICNMCGWDTDCNVGNVATIMGIVCGIEKIDYDKWIRPIKDILICSSVIGSLNIMDVPYGASFIAKLAYELAGSEAPAPFNDIFARYIHSAHFEYPTSTHGMRVRSEKPENRELEYYIQNTNEMSFSGNRSLKLTAMVTQVTQEIFLYQKTYYQPKDFHDSRYDPCFSPILYPGQTVTCTVAIPDWSVESKARVYVKDIRSGEQFFGERKSINNNGEWVTISLNIPRMEGALLGEAGIIFEIGGERKSRYNFTAYLDNMIFDGLPDYSVDYAKEEEEIWNFQHKEISQMTRLKGIMNLEDDMLNLSCSDFAEAYTGRYDWRNYKAEFDIVPVIGERHTVNFRTQGALRSYAFGFNGNGKIAILKNNNGYNVLAEENFAWELGKEYHLTVVVNGSKIVATCADMTIAYEDENDPWLEGSVGISVRNGSHVRMRRFSLKGI